VKTLAIRVPQAPHEVDEFEDESDERDDAWEPLDSATSERFSIAKFRKVVEAMNSNVQSLHAESVIVFSEHEGLVQNANKSYEEKIEEDPGEKSGSGCRRAPVPIAGGRTGRQDRIEDEGKDESGGKDDYIINDLRKEPVALIGQTSRTRKGQPDIYSRPLRSRLMHRRLRSGILMHAKRRGLTRGWRTGRKQKRSSA